MSKRYKVYTTGAVVRNRAVPGLQVYVERIYVEPGSAVVECYRGKRIPADRALSKEQARRVMYLLRARLELDGYIRL